MSIQETEAAAFLTEGTSTCPRHQPRPIALDFHSYRTQRSQRNAGGLLAYSSYSGIKQRGGRGLSSTTRAFDSCKRGSAAEVSAQGRRGRLSVSGSRVSPENPHLAAVCSTAGEFSSHPILLPATTGRQRGARRGSREDHRVLKK